MPSQAHDRLTRAANALAEIAYPTRCIGCDQPGELLCDSCRASLPWIVQRDACPDCGTPHGALTCTACDHDWETRAVVCALGSCATATRLVTCLKDEHELRLAPVIAAGIVTALEESAAWPASDGAPRYDADALDAACFVPATAEAYARRGFDHMQLVATAVAHELNLPLADVLVRASARDQRTLGRVDRLANLQDTVEVLDDVAGMDLLLLDDVVTTGASMRASARALLARGAASVTAAALVRVW